MLTSHEKNFLIKEAIKNNKENQLISMAKEYPDLLGEKVGDSLGSTLLMWSFRYQKIPLFNTFLDLASRATIEKVDLLGNNIVNLLIDSHLFDEKYIETIKKKAIYSLSHNNQNGDSLLKFSLVNGKIDTAEKYLSWGLKLSNIVLDDNFFTKIIENDDVLKWMVKKGWDLNSTSKEGKNILFYFNRPTTYNGKTIPFYRKIELDDGYKDFFSNMNINQKDVNGNTPLIVSTMSKNLRGLTNFFLSYPNVNLNISNNQGGNALFYVMLEFSKASSFFHKYGYLNSKTPPPDKEMVTYFIMNTKSLNSGIGNGKDVWSLACASKDEEVVNMLKSRTEEKMLTNVIVEPQDTKPNKKKTKI